VPQPSFANRAYAYARHRAALHDVAATFLKGVDLRPDPRPVYLSRSRLAKFNRFLVNEVALDEALAARGFLIAHPQEMDLAEQIKLFNTHRTFVGCVGSAFHSTLMTLNGEAITTHILSEKFPNVNCLLIDAIVGNESHYVSTCVKSPHDPGQLTIDVESTLGYLNQAGLL
jgi:capsular polysaccharide biosynthesis protein